MLMDFDWLKMKMKADINAKERWSEIIHCVECVGYRELEKHVLK